MDDERPLTVDEAADYLQISREMVRRMLRDGRLHGGRLGGRKLGWRVMRSELRALVERGGVQHGPGRPAARRAATAPATEPERQGRVAAQLLAQAERAAERGDDLAVARIAAALAGLEGEPGDDLPRDAHD